MPAKILIKGAGEMASAVAHRLFKCGFNVVMTELPRPTAVRRKVSFCSAILDPEITIEGVKAQQHGLADIGQCGFDHIPVVVDSACSLGKIWQPDVLVDARLLKKNLDNSITDAPLVIGLGPGIVAGCDVHFVIETNRGHNLGRVIASGMAEADTGEPGEVGGYTKQRVLKAPVSGLFETTTEIGDHVNAGEVVGALEGQPIKAQISGVVRGLLPNGWEVTVGQKLGDIDPRGKVLYCYTISDKARTISGSVLEVVVKGERAHELTSARAHER